jgi:hypothetical protein
MRFAQRLSQPRIRLRRRALTARKMDLEGEKRGIAFTSPATNRAQNQEAEMRQIGIALVLATMVAASACTSDRVLAPKSGHAVQISDLPPELFAAYTRTALPGTARVVALNDNGDVVGETQFTGVLWHGATHELTDLPIFPTAIANDGTVAGNLNGHAATWKNGRVTVLDTGSSTATAICRCESATVVGDVVVNGVTHAAIWANGIRIDAGLPPNSVLSTFTSIASGFVVGIAILRVPDPQTGGSSDFTQPFSWSPVGGWRRLDLGIVASGGIASVNSHGIGVGSEYCNCDRNLIADEVLYDVAAGTSHVVFPDVSFFDNILPSGINDSGHVSAPAEFLTHDRFPGTVALVDGRVLPPGVLGDVAVGINSAGIVGGQSNNLPVLWIPNP